MTAPPLTISYRKLDANWDMVFGGSGKNDYYTGIEAIAQAIVTRLKLFLGEWWLDTSDGLPMWQKILGVQGTKQKTVDQMIVNRILTTQLNGQNLVRDIASYSSVMNGDIRSYAFTATVDTVLGTLTLTNQGVV